MYGKEKHTQFPVIASQLQPLHEMKREMKRIQLFLGKSWQSFYIKSNTLQLQWPSSGLLGWHASGRLPSPCCTEKTSIFHFYETWSKFWSLEWTTFFSILFSVLCVMRYAHIFIGDTTAKAIAAETFLCPLNYFYINPLEKQWGKLNLGIFESLFGSLNPNSCILNELQSWKWL